MNEIVSNLREFRKLIKENKFQVFLFTSPLFKPLQFAVHSWLVTSRKGKIKRWDIWQDKNSVNPKLGHLYLNLMKPFFGMAKYLEKRYRRNKSSIIGYIEGGQNSLAEKMVKFIEKHAKNYPLKSEYKPYPGPNSNTFPQWIINKFPETNWKLPWNAFGKNYKRK